MTRDVRQAVGRPDSSAFIRKCIIYGIILAIMLFAAPPIFSKLMVPVAASGVKGAWYGVFVPTAAVMMAIGLFRAWRRRWPLGYMNSYRSEAEACNYETCPRCGAPLVLKKRTRNNRERVGEIVTTTTYTDGSKTVDRKDVYGTVKRTSYYHECTNSRCCLEVEQNIGQSHLPWKIRDIRCLVLNDDSLLPRGCTCAKHLLLSRLLVPILALVIVVASAALIYNYADWHDGEWTYATVDEQSDRSPEEYGNYLMSLDTEYSNWFVTYEKEPTTMMNYLAGFFKKGKAVSYTVGGYNVGGGDIYDYRFEGDDAGTGIPHGWYTLTRIDGVSVLIDEDNELIYKQGSEFYETFVPKLRELTHDKALAVILERTRGGEHGIFNGSVPMEFIRKDNSTVLAYLYDDYTYGNDFRGITIYPDEQIQERWYFEYRTGDYYPDDWEGFVYADDDTFDVDDELGKLMQESFDDSGSVVFFKNDEEVLQISIDYFPDGYAFDIYDAVDGYNKGLEEDIVYRVNTTDKTLTKIENYDYSDEKRTDMPLPANQTTYDFLLSIVPHTYIRRLIDMDKAEVRKESAGLVTVYEMKDENGNVDADMRLAFGKIGEVNHYTAEGEYVKIELGY